MLEIIQICKIILSRNFFVSQMIHENIENNKERQRERQRMLKISGGNLCQITHNLTCSVKFYNKFDPSNMLAQINYENQIS